MRLALPAIKPLAFAKVCLAEAVVEVLYLLILVMCVELELVSYRMQENMHEEGWYVVVSFFTNLQRFWVYRGLVRRLSRHRAPPTNAVQAPPLDSFAVWWCVFISMVISMWYIVQATQWYEDKWNCVAVAIFGFLNLALGTGWASVLRAAANRKPWALQVLQVFTLGAMGEAGTEELPFGSSCPVCLVDMEDGDVVGQLPCGHSFHRRCVEDWLRVRAQCPMRCPLVQRTVSTAEGAGSAAGAGAALSLAAGSAAPNVRRPSAASLRAAATSRNATPGGPRVSAEIVGSPMIVSI
uniref:RING-type domain-containing protein n=1 Tax=Pyrodinium bahamense TaxID=73915 RepID=A0A7S0FKF3_9DINO|mmetsp:Transcript_3564/g.9703  ORF Transcript_3564/g.9703 Transcript_3564/m.9703 type:complete len:295 (+) Transcript_3564:76-960(+)